MGDIEIKKTPSLLLAYIGDAVYELRVREHLLQSGAVKVNGLHKQAVGYVNAGRQSRLYAQIEPMLNDDERDVFRRARNTKCGHHPLHASVIDYHRATGLEALIGFLYLSGENERLAEIFSILFTDNE